MGDRWIVIVRTTTSDVTSEVTVEEFGDFKEAQAHFDGLRSTEHARIIDAYLAIIHTEKH